MAGTNKRAVSAAPKKNATVTVTVSQVDRSGKVVERLGGVLVEVKDSTIPPPNIVTPPGTQFYKMLDSGRSAKSGKTQGTWKSRPVTSEEHTIAASLDGFWTETGDPFWVLVQKLKPGVNNVEVRLVKNAPRVKVRVEDPANGNVPVGGAAVAIQGPNDPESVKTDLSGVALTSGLFPGTYTLTITKPGHGPTASQVGPVTRQVTIAAPTANPPTDIDLQPALQICRVWSRVHNSGVTVAGQPFATWYNNNFENWGADFKIRGIDFRILDKAAFSQLFDDCAQWWIASDMSVEEFVGMFLVTTNETGGGYLPLVEVYSDGHKKIPPDDPRSLKYFFEPNSYTPKSSYNFGNGNIPAGDALLKDGHIPQSRQAAWNDTTKYPIEDAERQAGLERWVKECDFNKFRGRGFNQITGRANYKGSVDPLLTNAHLSANGKAPIAGKLRMDVLSDDDLTKVIRNDTNVSYGMMKRFLRGVSSLLAAANSYEWRTFGTGFAGGSYPDLFARRAARLFDEMNKAGVIVP